MRPTLDTEHVSACFADLISDRLAHLYGDAAPQPALHVTPAGSAWRVDYRLLFNETSVSGTATAALDGHVATVDAAVTAGAELVEGRAAPHAVCFNFAALGAQYGSRPIRRKVLEDHVLPRAVLRWAALGKEAARLGDPAALEFYRLALLSFRETALMFSHLEGARGIGEPALSTPARRDAFARELRRDIVAAWSQAGAISAASASALRERDGQDPEDTPPSSSWLLRHGVSVAASELPHTFKTRSVRVAARHFVEFALAHRDDADALLGVSEHLEEQIIWSVRQERNVVAIAPLFAQVFDVALAHRSVAVCTRYAALMGIWLNTHLLPVEALASQAADAADRVIDRCSGLRVFAQGSRRCDYGLADLFAHSNEREKLARVLESVRWGNPDEVVYRCARFLPKELHSRLVSPHAPPC